LTVINNRPADFRLAPGSAGTFLPGAGCKQYRRAMPTSRGGITTSGGPLDRVEKSVEPAHRSELFTA
jgi:hypothetical protein